MISSCSHFEANLKCLPSEFYWIWSHFWNSSVMFFSGIANQIRWDSSSNSPNEIRAKWFGIMWQLHVTARRMHRCFERLRSWCTQVSGPVFKQLKPIYYRLSHNVTPCYCLHALPEHIIISFYIKLWWHFKVGFS